MALKPGGIVISLLEAREINDPPEYMQSFHFNDVIEMEKAVRNKFTIPFYCISFVPVMSKQHGLYRNEKGKL